MGRADQRRRVHRARSRRWPGCGCRSTSTTARPQDRRDLAAALRATGVDRHAGAAGRAVPQAARRGRRARAAAHAAAPAPLPRLPGAGGARPLGGAARPGWSGTPRRCADKVAGRTGSLARTFDRVCALLDRRGYLPPAARSPTPAGCWPGSGPRRTCWSPSACAAACGTGSARPSWPRPSSVVVYEARRESDERASVPRGAGGRRGRRDAEAVGRAARPTRRRTGCR